MNIYSVYIEFYTYFFVGTVKNNKEDGVFLWKMTHLQEKKSTFENERQYSRCFYAENIDVVKQQKGEDNEK